jgi:ribose transport system substrate-binding protein
LLEKVTAMIRFSMTGSILGVVLLDAVCMYALHVSLEAPIGPRPRLLLIGSGAGEYWQRTIEGARDAARELGVELEVELSTQDDLVDQQSSIMRRINPANYDGVAISPVDPESQIELINDLASQTKLVTVDRDDCKCQQLCHIGFGQTGAGALVARLVRDQLSCPGKVALLATTFSEDARNTNVSERLAGFKEMWGPSGQDDAMPCPIIEVDTDSDFSATLADPELAFIVAFDSNSAKSALKSLASQSNARRVPIIAFEPDEAIFDAIDDGRVCAAILHDPYRAGYTSIQRLSDYQGADKASLPAPGYGNFLLVSEVVQKENLADFRRRLDHKCGGTNVTVSSNNAAKLLEALPATPGCAAHHRNSPTAGGP